MLKLSPDLKLPDDFATEGVAVIGMRGSGKSNTQARWCEVLHGAGIPFVVIEPKGDWGGIRSSADGKHPGLPIPVFGGITGDFPLTEHLGARIADLLVDQNLSAVLDVSLLSKEKRARFLTEFFDRLMERHQQAPHVRCVVLEEAHRYIPQVIPQGPPSDKGLYARLKEAAAAVLLEGRAWGLGCWAATQRPARLHKDVLEEVGTAIIHRIGVAASNDLKTIRGWVQHEDLGPEIGPSLTKMKTGEAWVLAPATLGIAQRVLIDRRTTFDSASTPIVGAGLRPTVTMADIDVAAINEALSDAIERAKAIDPVELNRRIKELEIELAAERARQPIAPEPVIDEVEVVPPAVWEVFETMRSAAVAIDDSVTAGRVAWNEIDAAMDALQAVRNKADHAAREQASAPRAPKPSSPQVQQPKTSSAAAAPLRGSKDSAAKRVMRVLAIHGPCTPGKLATLAGISPKSSTLRGALAELRRDGHVNTGHPITATPDGLTALGTPEPLPTGEALLNYWMSELGDSDNADRKVLSALVKAYPANLTPEELEAETGISQGSSTTRGALAKLRKLGLAQKGARRANDEFMEAINS